jgi:flagellin
MSLNSINTNVGAQIALQTLNTTNAALQQAQNEVSTGLAIAQPSDGGAIWSIAQGQRAQVTALGSVTDSLNRASSALDVAVSAGQQISDLLTQLAATALNATDQSLTSTNRASLNSQYKSLLNQITQTVGQATFNGANLISGASTSTAILALASADGKTRLTIQPANLSITTGLSLSTTDLNSSDDATTALSQVNKAIDTANNDLAVLGTSQNAVSTTLTFTSNLSNALVQGVGSLVDADVAAESATLQSLQTKQQLGVQALSIANSSSSVLLSLFRG